eukprot:GHVS01071777.1.p1 GENE.GHVS01071777.1~~GHVS01071777.1.p1  ORF type:complete len:862 (-),score=154.19 GHVS01071777.1:489-2807(-)
MFRSPQHRNGRYSGSSKRLDELTRQEGEGRDNKFNMSIAPGDYSNRSDASTAITANTPSYVEDYSPITPNTAADSGSPYTPSISLHPPPPGYNHHHRHCVEALSAQSQAHIPHVHYDASPSSPCPAPQFYPYRTTSNDITASAAHSSFPRPPTTTIHGDPFSPTTSSFGNASSRGTSPLSPHRLSVPSSISSPTICRPAPQQPSLRFSPPPWTSPPPPFEWRVIKEDVKRRLQAAETFTVCGVPFSKWKFQKIPTLGASPSSCRVQEMYKADIIASIRGQQEEERLGRVFIKTIPLNVWNKQWEAQGRWGGEFVTDGENFVMEAAVLSYLQGYAPSLAPSLLGVLQITSQSPLGATLSKKHPRPPSGQHNAKPSKTGPGILAKAISIGRPRGSGSRSQRHQWSKKQHLGTATPPPPPDTTAADVVGGTFGSHGGGGGGRMGGGKAGNKSGGKSGGLGEVTHIALVSELYGEDLLDYIERREKEGVPLQKTEKRQLQFGALCCMRLLHSLGLAHLDFTPENLLIGKTGLRLCDFAKTTPLYTRHPRHLMNADIHGLSSESRLMSTYTSDCSIRHGCGPLYVFESCEPTVGKGAYMPPECWRVYWKLEDTKVQYPLSELRATCTLEERKGYYFRVREADTYMLGVLLFWIWADGGIWKCSDLTQDERYHHLVRSHLNFDLFRECRPWPKLIKDLLQKTLSTSPSQRLKLEELEKHRWWTFDLSEEEQKTHPPPQLPCHCEPAVPANPREGAVEAAGEQRGGEAAAAANWDPNNC